MSAYQNLHSKYRSTVVEGRYLPIRLLNLALNKMQSGNEFWKVVGQSVEGRDILCIEIGNGPLRILMWSQMHGNETTTTKAVLDLLNFLSSGDPEASFIKEKCTLCILPMLNPDGAEKYTRVNANKKDLNRDAVERSEPESQVLMKLFQSFKPSFCFNLHDQRTLFNVGQTAIPATLSFLSPSADEARSITESRKVSMALIAGINNKLQEFIPGQVGRYDDSFNLNCVGDTFQAAGIPTILYEAGHFPGDYLREETRTMVFIALMEALGLIARDKIGEFSIDDYHGIPENGKMFFDILINRMDLLVPELEKGFSAGIRYREVLADGDIRFEPYLAQLGDLDGYYGHATYDCSRPEELEIIKNDASLFDLF